MGASVRRSATQLWPRTRIVAPIGSRKQPKIPAMQTKSKAYRTCSKAYWLPQPEPPMLLRILSADVGAGMNLWLKLPSLSIILKRAGALSDQNSLQITEESQGIPRSVRIRE